MGFMTPCTEPAPQPPLSGRNIWKTNDDACDETASQAHPPMTPL
jgi:hypothetical protein